MSNRDSDAYDNVGTTFYVMLYCKGSNWIKVKSFMDIIHRILKRKMYFIYAIISIVNYFLIFPVFAYDTGII